MITGTYLNDYKFNGTSLLLQPTEGQWEKRTQYGNDGIGHPVYATPRKFVMSWDYMDTEHFQQLMSFYSPTGTIIATLPGWNITPYTFRAYSGTVMSEPEVGAYYMNYYSNVKLELLAILT
jgi:hypothetical protein